MLTALRDGAKSGIAKFVLFGFLVLAVGGLVLTDVGGFFRGGVGLNDVARAGKEKIGIGQFDMTVRRILSQQGATPKEAYQFGLIDQILQNEVGQRLMTQHAMETGIFISDNDVADHIARLIEPMAKMQPGTSKANLLRNILVNQGMSEQEFVGAIRRSMMNTVVQTTIQSAATGMPRAEAVALYQAQNETRTVEALVLPNESIKTVEPAADEILFALYEASKATRFSIPETRTFSMIVLDEKNIASTITLSDDALMAEYNLNKSRFSTPERRHVQQAIVETTEAADAVLAALAKQGTDKNLKNAVKTATGKETAYLGEQAFEQKGMLEALAKPTFDAAINDVIGPVQSPLGFHILVVKKILPAEVKPFDAVKAELKKDLTERRLSNALYEAANIIDDRLASGETLEAIAADMSLKIAKYGPVRADGSSPDDREAMKDFAQDRSFIMQSVFDMNEGEAAPVLELKDGRYAAIRVDTITPRSFKPYESVKAEIAKTWLEDQKAAANRTRALEWQQAVSSGEKTLADAAREAGLRTQTLNLKRSGQPPQPIDAAAQQQLFNAVKGETTLAATADGFVLAVIKDASLPPADLVTDAQLKPITDAAVRDQREELLLSTMQHLEKKFGVRFNRATLDRLYGPESAY